MGLSVNQSGKCCHLRHQDRVIIRLDENRRELIHKTRFSVVVILLEVAAVAVEVDPADDVAVAADVELSRHSRK